MMSSALLVQLLGALLQLLRTGLVAEVFGLNGSLAFVTIEILQWQGESLPD
jgi:hypothetical protein